MPHAAIGCLDVFLVLLVGAQVFGVPVGGSVLPLALPGLFLLALRYCVAIMRGIFLKRTGVALLWHQVVPMTLLG